ncbi:sarcospan [Phascolarctos cinereus]|uniref:Sarcospan n=1 Tax=Phascolarctos cinereus TaxID=38626 RepID=A0A6P5IEZ4_PHACI|nr:sarcospan [Phascolarctos cinereus]
MLFLPGGSQDPHAGSCACVHSGSPAAPHRRYVPSRWQFAIPLDSPSPPGSLWHLEAPTVCSKCFPYLFSLRDSNTGSGSACAQPSEFLGAPQPTHPPAMGQNEQPPAPNAPQGKPRKGPTAPAGDGGTASGAQSDPGPKKGKGDPKACREEEARTCCGCRFPLLLALLQLALGIAVTTVGFVMAGISSSLLVRETPFWAGIIVCVVSYLGLFMLCVSYQVDERTCIQFAMKLFYFLMSALSLVVCVLAVAFAAHHYSQLTQLICKNTLDSCQCRMPTSDPLSRAFVYQDVSDCTSITSTFKLFLLVQMVLNLLCALVCLLACFMMWKHRYQVFYAGVRLHSLTTSEGQQQKV